MPTYVHGWRRKLGVITLVMACGLMAFWLRSYVATDIISDDTFDNCEFKTGGGQLCWSRWHTEITSKHELGCCGGMRRGRTWETKPYSLDDFQFPSDFQYTARLLLPGLELSDLSRHAQLQTLTIVSTVRVWSLSVLWFVVPLTLLSAYLLLSKTKTPKPTSRPLS